MVKRFFLAILGALVFFHTAFAIDFPQPQGFVNDFAGVLTAEQRTALESQVRSFEQETSNEISIAIVPSLGGLDRFTYSQELFNRWKVGKEGKNNGVLFLIAIQEREAFINVGKGLEGVLPDSLVGTILRNEVFPRFKQSRYFEGISRGVTAILAASRDEYRPKDQSFAKVNRLEVAAMILAAMIFLSLGVFLPPSRFGIKGLFVGLTWALLLVVAFRLGFGRYSFYLLFPFTYFIVFLARSKSWWLGGIIGAFMGLVGGALFSSGVWIFIFVAEFTLFGLLLDYGVSKNYQYRKSHGKPTDFWHSGGGFWRGGRGGGFGGGGFGGFGGGFSGGGGAGGRW